MMYWDEGSWSWVAMILMMTIVWGGIIGGIVLLIRSTNAPTHPPIPHPHDDGERILAERFARGEIDQDEFEQRRAILKNRS